MDRHTFIRYNCEECKFNKINIPKRNMWEELKQRWVSESPKFWKKIMSIAIAIGSSATAVVASDQLFNLQGYGIAPIVFTVAGYVIVACAAIGLSAKITTQ